MYERAYIVWKLNTYLTNLTCVYEPLYSVFAKLCRFSQFWCKKTILHHVCEAYNPTGKLKIEKHRQKAELNIHVYFIRTINELHVYRTI